MFTMKGVVPPLITPFDACGLVDYKSLDVLLDFLTGKVDGVFVTGSYGAGALMSIEERKKVVEAVIKRVKGKMDVIVMTGTTNNAETMELTKHAVTAGANAVSSIGPYYFKHNADSLCYYFEDMVKAADDKLNVYVYNNPGFQGYPMDIKLLKKLKDLGVKGIKDATFDIILHAQYHRVLKDDNFDVVLGTEAMWLAAWSLGCNGFIPGLGNAFPEICKKMYEEAVQGAVEECRLTQFKVNKMRDIMYLAKSTMLAVYAMLEIRGVIKAYPRAPFIAATEEEKKNIRDALCEMEMV